MSDEKKMRVFFEALADNVGSLSDEELLAEVREEGRSPEDVVKQTSALSRFDPGLLARSGPPLSSRR